MRDRPLRGLIVDDEGLTLFYLRKALAIAGYEIAGMAVNGQEAVEQARVLKPDFITMDMNMGTMGGLDAIREIMAERPLPIIVVSANGSHEDEAKAREAGASGYVVKPTNGTALAERIKQSIDAFAKAHE